MLWPSRCSCLPWWPVGGTPPPEELLRLQTVADPLLRANRIRSTPIHFSLEAGETAGYWARQLGLCLPEAASGSDPDQQCEAWNHGDRATASDPLQRQVYRLAYLFGGASARTSPQGWISFDRSFFLVHRDDPAALRCAASSPTNWFMSCAATPTSAAAGLSSRICGTVPRWSATAFWPPSVSSRSWPPTGGAC